MYYCNTVPSSTFYNSNILFAAGACGGTLSRGQVQNIQNHRNGLYAVANGVVINKKLPVDLYSLLDQHFSTRSIEGAHVWLSHPPIGLAFDALKVIFGDARNKPTLHIQSIAFGSSAYDAVKGMGCLAKLSDAFRIVRWDWAEFGRTFGRCSHYTESNTKEKKFTEKILSYVGSNVASSPLAKLC